MRAIFSGVDMDIPRGKITAILGPSGTGKTTLLKLIGGALKPQKIKQGANTVLKVNDLSIPNLKLSDLLEARKQMGILFQSGALFTDLSVFDNVAFPLREHTQMPESTINDIVLAKLHAVGLKGAAQLYPTELSGGMARRVALARAIVLDPALMMYDEPFTGQDPISMGVLMRLIKSLNESLGMTSIVVSHDVAEVLSIADYCYVVASGKVIAHGTPAQIQTSDSPWVQQFIKGESDGPVPFHYPAPPDTKRLKGAKP